MAIEGGRQIYGRANSLNVNWNADNGLNVDNWNRDDHDWNIGALARQSLSSFLLNRAESTFCRRQVVTFEILSNHLTFYQFLGVFLLKSDIFYYL